MFKTKCVLPVCGAMLLISVSVTLTSHASYSQKRVPNDSIVSQFDSQSKVVNVVNSSGVVMTNPIPLASDTSVNLNSPATRLLFQTPSGGVLVNMPQDLGDVDVSSSKQIRVVVVNHSHSVPAIVKIQVVEGNTVLGNMDTLTAGAETDASATVFDAATKVYDVPGRTLRINAKGGTDPQGTQGSTRVDVLVFGR